MTDTSVCRTETNRDKALYKSIYVYFAQHRGGTSVDVDDGVVEEVAAELSVDVGLRTADRAAATDAVTSDRQSAVALHRRRVVRRQLKSGVTVSLTRTRPRPRFNSSPDSFPTCVSLDIYNENPAGKGTPVDMTA